MQQLPAPDIAVLVAYVVVAFLTALMIAKMRGKTHSD